MVVYDCEWNPANASNVITTAITSSKFVSKLSFSHFWSPKPPNSCKMRPHSGSYFSYCPSNLSSTHSNRLQPTQIELQWSQTFELSPPVNSNRHAIVVFASNDPEFIANQSELIANRLELYHMPPNRLRLVANRLKLPCKLPNRLRIVANKLMTHPLVSRRTAMP